LPEDELPEDELPEDELPEDEFLEEEPDEDELEAGVDDEPLDELSVLDPPSELVAVLAEAVAESLT
jgi:hypothetical protein